VRAALDASEDVVKDAMTVSVLAGVVTLAGSVADVWQSLLAEDIARSARGVRDVRNSLVSNIEHQANDDEAALGIRDSILRVCGNSASDVRVAVSGHQIVLSGNVSLRAHKVAAMEVARLSGRIDIRNDIRVVPQD